ncbi:unnamed protein product, partial [Urochloa humidicola]
RRHPASSGAASSQCVWWRSLMTPPWQLLGRGHLPEADLGTNHVALEAGKYRADFREQAWPVCPHQLNDIV